MTSNVTQFIHLEFRNNEKIQGILVKVNNLKITQLSDKTTLFSSNEQIILRSLNTVETFGSFSGLTQKSTGINWSTKVKRLGNGMVRQNKEECEQPNWASKMNECEKLVKFVNKKKHLTFYGYFLII